MCPCVWIAAHECRCPLRCVYLDECAHQPSPPHTHTQAWSVYAERGELTALQIAVTLWAKSDWGKKELQERIEEMCGDFLGALARLLDPLDDQRVGG